MTPSAAAFALLLSLAFRTSSAFDGLVPPSRPAARRPSSARPTTPSPLRAGWFDFSNPASSEEKEEEVPPPAPAPADEDQDPVEKLFSFFFGAKEEAPMGMARFGRERFPEQYPATKDEFAAPVASDPATGEIALLRPLLKNTNLESRGLRLVYDGDRSGYDAAKFHRAADKGGPSLVACTTREGLTFGGYNPKGWVGYGEARGSVAAFLFTVAPGAKPGDAAKLTKLRKVGGPGLAQLDYPESGPRFGADSLILPLDGSRVARSKLGSYYERFPDGGNSLFGKKSQTQMKSFRVYQGVWGKDEYVPFTDAEPFALS